MSEDYDSQVTALQGVFENLFSLPSAPAQVSTIIRNSPLPACADALAVAILSSAQARPLSIDVLIGTLAVELSSTKDLIFISDDAGYIEIPFNDAFELHLGNFLTTALFELYPQMSKQTIISPQNPMLSSALLLGSVVVNDLMGRTVVNELVDQGLQLPDAVNVEKKRAEVVAIGACLVLLVAGSVLVDDWVYNEYGRLGKVTRALEVLRRNKVVKHPKGVGLLEKTIGSAKRGFKATTTAVEAWKLLFPKPTHRKVVFPAIRIVLDDFVGGFWFRPLVPVIEQASINRII